MPLCVLVNVLAEKHTGSMNSAGEHGLNIDFVAGNFKLLQTEIARVCGKSRLTIKNKKLVTKAKAKCPSPKTKPGDTLKVNEREQRSYVIYTCRCIHNKVLATSSTRLQEVCDLTKFKAHVAFVNMLRSTQKVLSFNSSQRRVHYQIKNTCSPLSCCKNHPQDILCHHTCLRKLMIPV